MTFDSGAFGTLGVFSIEAVAYDWAGSSACDFFCDLKG